MKTVMRNIMDEFRNLCITVTKNDELGKHEDVPFKDKKWILLRAPWQDPLPNEHLIPKAPSEPPRWIVDHHKAVLSQWFFKDTLATPYSRVE